MQKRLYFLQHVMIVQPTANVITDAPSPKQRFDHQSDHKRPPWITRGARGRAAICNIFNTPPNSQNRIKLAQNSTPRAPPCLRDWDLSFHVRKIVFTIFIPDSFKFVESLFILFDWSSVAAWGNIEFCIKFKTAAAVTSHFWNWFADASIQCTPHKCCKNMLNKTSNEPCCQYYFSTGPVHM